MTNNELNSGGGRFYQVAAIFLIIEFLILFIPLIILGTSINWPASLDEPASVNLPLILEQYSSVMTGYGIYLVYSFLFWPVAYLTGRVIVGDDLDNVLFKVANGFAILSVIARSLGIVRWLFTMPVLAKMYTEPSANDLTKEYLNAMYEMLNSYAGGVGELLGVSLFTVIWLVVIGLLMLRTKAFPNWLSYFGFISAASLFANLAEATGVDMGPMITISVVFLHIWMLSTAIIFIKKSRQVQNLNN